MRKAGFPCRVVGCDRSFPVEDQSSMGALTAASQARSHHEIEAHDYHHVILAETPRVWTRSAAPKIRGAK